MSRPRWSALALGVLLFSVVVPGQSAGPPATFWGDRDAYGLWLGAYTYGRMALPVGATAEGSVGVIHHGSGGGCGPVAYAGDEPTYQVESAVTTATTILRVTLGNGGHIILEGLAEGDADLSLLDASGKELDHFTIPVRAITSIGESLEDVGTDVVLAGGDVADVVLPRVNGYDVAARPPVDAVASGTLSIATGDPVSRQQTVWVRGTSGWGHLVLTAPGGAHAERDLYVAPADRVKSVTLALEGAPRQGSGNTYAVTVVSTATLDDGRKVMAPRCDYSVEGPDSTVTERVVDGARVLERRADIGLLAKGVYRITCRLGAGSATVVTESP